jgi:large subunit ribosomal protein L4
MYRAGIASILSQLVREERLKVIDAIAADSPKTRSFAKQMKGLGLEGTVLVVTDRLDENVFLASRNLPDVLVLEAREVDPVSLVRFHNVLLTKAAVGQFEEMLG